MLGLSSLQVTCVLHRHGCRKYVKPCVWLFHSLVSIEYLLLQSKMCIKFCKNDRKVATETYELMLSGIRDATATQAKGFWWLFNF